MLKRFIVVSLLVAGVLLAALVGSALAQGSWGSTPTPELGIEPWGPFPWTPTPTWKPVIGEPACEPCELCGICTPTPEPTWAGGDWVPPTATPGPCSGIVTAWPGARKRLSPWGRVVGGWRFGTRIEPLGYVINGDRTIWLAVPEEGPDGPVVFVLRSLVRLGPACDLKQWVGIAA